MYNCPSLRAVEGRGTELAACTCAQVHSMISKLAQFTDIRIALVVGGLSLQVQAATLRTSPEVVVATPVCICGACGYSQTLCLCVRSVHCCAIFLLCEVHNEAVELLHWIYLPARICLLASLKPSARSSRHGFADGTSFSWCAVLCTRVTIQTVMRFCATSSAATFTENSIAA